MTEPEKKEKKIDTSISIDLGLGGLFKGLGDLLDVVGSLTESGGETTRTGEFKVKGLGEKGRGVFGFSIRTNLAGAPQVEQFGNIRSTERGPEVAEVREPLVDVFDEEQVILIVAELPGVREDEIRVNLQDDVLSIETTGARKYAKEILLPSPFPPENLQKSYQNGILELRLKKT